MESKPSERLNFVLNHLNMNPTSLAKSIGMKRPQPFFHIKADEYGISQTIANRIRSVYPQFSEKWLIKGEGLPFEKGMESYKTVAERVKIVMDHFYKNKDQFAAIIDMSADKVDDVVAKNINPSTVMLKKISEAFPTVNEVWLKGGEGKMIKEENNGNDRALLMEAMERIEAYLRRNDTK